MSLITQNTNYWEVQIIFSPATVDTYMYMYCTVTFTKENLLPVYVLVVNILLHVRQAVDIKGV